MVTFEQLPQTVLLNIFSRLGPVDILRVAQSCTPLHELIFDSLDFLWREISFTGIEHAVTNDIVGYITESLEEAARRKPNGFRSKVRILSLSGLRISNTLVLKLLLLCGEGLEILDLSGCTAIEKDGRLLLKVLRMAPNVKVLRLAYCKALNAESVRELARMSESPRLEFIDLSFSRASPSAHELLRLLISGPNAKKIMPRVAEGSDSLGSQCCDVWQAVSMNDQPALEATVKRLTREGDHARWLLEARWQWTLQGRKAEVACPCVNCFVHDSEASYCPYLHPRDWQLTGASLLHAAVVDGSLECIRYLLLEHGMDPLSLNVARKTPMLYALEELNNEKVSRLLFDCIRTIRLPGDVLYQHLVAFAECGGPEMFDMFLRLTLEQFSKEHVLEVVLRIGCKTSRRNDFGGNLDSIVLLLLKQGASPIFEDKGGKGSALEIACQGQNADVIRLLSCRRTLGQLACLQFCAEPAGHNILDLMMDATDPHRASTNLCALLSGHFDPLYPCVESACEKLVMDKYMRALAEGHGTFARTVIDLLPSQVCALVKDSRRSPHPLHLAAQSYGRKDNRSKDELLLCGKKMISWTKFMSLSSKSAPATESRSNRLLAFLGLSRSRVKQKQTVQSNFRELVNITDEFSRTPVHFAALSQDISFLDSLLEAGGNPNAIDQHGQSPLHYAVMSKLTLAAVESLISHGADSTIRDCRGRNPLVLGLQRNNRPCAQFLIARAGTELCDDPNRVPPRTHFSEWSCSEPSEDENYPSSDSSVERKWTKTGPRTAASNQTSHSRSRRKRRGGRRQEISAHEEEIDQDAIAHSPNDDSS